MGNINGNDSLARQVFKKLISRSSVSLRYIPLTILSTFILAGILSAADLPAALQISSTTVPPGAMAQIRVPLAAPQTIAIGAFSMDFDPAFFDDIADVRMFSAAGDVIGIANIKGRHVDVAILVAIRRRRPPARPPRGNGGDPRTAEHGGPRDCRHYDRPKRKAVEGPRRQGLRANGAARFGHGRSRLKY
jgi:hypothetical protein